MNVLTAGGCWNNANSTPQTGLRVNCVNAQIIKATSGRVQIIKNKEMSFLCRGMKFSSSTTYQHNK